MNLGADLAPFFNVGEFAVAAVWQPSGGGSAITESVILDSADAELLSGRQIATEYRITFPASSSLAAITEDESLTVAGVAYTVRDVRKIDDGALVAVSLEAM